MDDSPKEERPGFGRALGRIRGNSESTPQVSGIGPGAGVGIVVADSVSDRPFGRAPKPEPEEAPTNPAAKAGWTSVKARTAARVKGTAETEAVSDEAPIPRSRLGRSRSTETTGGRAPRVRRARLKVVNVDPWSMMKVSFLFSVALGLVFMVAVALLWTALDVMGVFSSVGHTVSDVSGGANSSGFNVVSFFSLPRVMGIATILALVNTIMITALATLASYLYNLSTELVGGLEMTLAEEE